MKFVTKTRAIGPLQADKNAANVSVTFILLFYKSREEQVQFPANKRETSPKQRPTQSFKVQMADLLHLETSFQQWKLAGTPAVQTISPESSAPSKDASLENKIATYLDLAT